MGVLDHLLDTRAGAPSGALSEGYWEADHPRDFLGRWKKKVGALKVGETADLPDGTQVKRASEKTFEVHGRARVGDLATSAKHRAQLEREGTPHTRLGPGVSDPGKAAILAVQKSVQSDDPKSLGGRTKYRSAKDWLDKGGELSKADDAGRKRQAERDEIERKSPGAARAAADRQDALSGRGGSAPDRQARLAQAQAGAKARDAIRDKIASLPKGQRYSVVNGRGNPVGHVEKTDAGYEVVLPKGIKTYVTPGAAALAVDAYERQAKATEMRRQGERRANIERMESNRRSRSRSRG